MAFGLGSLQLAPEQFWSMTPRELAAAARGFAGLPHPCEPLSRVALADLAARFPDQPRGLPS